MALIGKMKSTNDDPMNQKAINKITEISKQPSIIASKVNYLTQQQRNTNVKAEFLNDIQLCYLQKKKELTSEAKTSTDHSQQIKVKLFSKCKPETIWSTYCSI